MKKQPLTRAKLLQYARKFIARGADVNFTSMSSEYGLTLLI